MEIEVSSASSRVLRISTEMLPEREGFSAFREDFARRVLKADVIDRGAGRPRIEITFLPLGVVDVGTMVATPMEFVRNKHHLKDGNDDFLLEIVEAGHAQHVHAGKEGVYDAGSAFFVDQGRPLWGFGPCDGGRVRNIIVRAAALKSLVSDPEDLAGHPLRPPSPPRLPAVAHVPRRAAAA
jgi:hypothetical protein